MTLVFDPSKPITRLLGDLTLDNVIDSGYSVKKLGTKYLYDPFDDRKFEELYLWDVIKTYEYEEDNDIEYHELDLDPFLTEFIHNDREFNIFIDLLRILFSDIRSVADVFDRLSDVNSAPEIFLPKLAALLSYRYKYEVPDDVNREIIKRLLWVYEGKGTDTDILEAADFGDNPKWVGRTLFMPGAEIDERVATLEYPVHNLFTHDVSAHSETDRFQDSTRYRDGVLIINLLELTPEIKDALRKVVPAGIKIYFNVVSDFSSDDDNNESVTGRPGILVFGAWFNYFAKSYLIDYYMRVSDSENFESSTFDGDLDYYDHVFSGAQVFFRDFIFEYKNVASYIPIYIKDYFGNLTLDYVPEEIPETNSIARYVLNENIETRRIERTIEALEVADSEEDEPSKQTVLSVYNGNFIYSEALYNSGEGTPITDDSELKDLIEDVETSLAEVVGCDDPSSEGYAGMLWVPKEDYKALVYALTTARKEFETANTQEQLDHIQETLQQALDDFNSKIQVFEPEVIKLRLYKLEQLLKLGPMIQELQKYALSDPIDYRYPGNVDYQTTDVFKNLLERSIPGYWGQLPEFPEFKFSPYTENPIHDIEYEVPDVDVRVRWDGLPIRSVNAGFSGKYRFGGENNLIEETYPINEITPQDTYYPVSSIEHLYVNQWNSNPLIAVNYDGVHTAVDSYTMELSKFTDDDLVDVDGKAVKFADLSEDQIAELTVNGLLMRANTNDFYASDYTDPIEIEIQNRQ